MKSNQELEEDVQDALIWEPILNEAAIGVIADNGVVTLSGTVDTNLKKTKAEDTARTVLGVKAVVETIEVKYDNDDETSDQELAKAVLTALKADPQIPADLTKVQVENGWVTLAGEFPWNYQKQAVQKAVRHLNGVKVLSNDITIRPEAANEVEKAAIESAFRRSAAIDEAHLNVSVLGNKVTLTGVVRSYLQRDEAERMAWNAPGVRSVDNEIAIDFNE